MMTGNAWADSATILGGLAMVLAAVLRIFSNGKKPNGSVPKKCAEHAERLVSVEVKHQGLSEKVDDLKVTVERNHEEQRTDIRAIGLQIEGVRKLILKNGRDNG